MFKRHQGTKCSEKCQSILIHIIDICKYSIEVNLNAVYCCACTGITLYCTENSIMQDLEISLKCPISYTQTLHARFKFFKLSDYLPLN